MCSAHSVPALGRALSAHGASRARKLSIDGYLAFYRIADDAIHVMRVVDQRRLLEAIKLDEE